MLVYLEGEILHRLNIHHEKMVESRKDAADDGGEGDGDA